MFVSYRTDHANNVYRLLNLMTNHTMKSSDVIWLNKCYGEWIKLKDSFKKTEDKLSDSEVEEDGSKEQKVPELPEKKNETLQSKKAGLILIRQDSCRCKILESTW